MEQVAIIGSGPAGLTAAIYCSRAGYAPVVIGGVQPGGQLTTTTLVENFPGFAEGINGPTLMQAMRQQAENVGARMVIGTVTRVDRRPDGNGFVIQFEEGPDMDALVVIVATGASALTLPLPNWEKLMGYGLSTCAICDGFFYRNKKVIVVGGGDSAMEEASYLAKLASSVHLIHRRETFRASKAMQDRVFANPKITIVTNAQVVDTRSDESGLTGVVVRKNSGEEYVLDTDGLFMAIGHRPNTSFVAHLVETDAEGYIRTQQGTLTNVPGLFAAGDVSDRIFRQAITAAGLGCQAALQAGSYLESLEG